MPAASIISGCPIASDHEEIGFSPDTIALLKKMGHTVQQGGNQGTCQVIVVQSAGRHARGRPGSPRV